MSQGSPKAVREARAALRACWREAMNVEVAPLGGQGPGPELRARHEAALDALLAAGAVEAAAADQVRAAFDETLEHLQRQAALCYIAFPVEMMPRQDLLEQVRALDEMAGASALAPGAVARVRAALEQDIAWLASFQARQSPLPLWRGMAVGPAASQAALILSDILSARE